MRPTSANPLRTVLLALVAIPAMCSCQMNYSIGYHRTRDMGVDSRLWRHELQGKRVAVAVYTNALNDMPEVGSAYKMTGPKSSSQMNFSGSKWKRLRFLLQDTRAKIYMGLGSSPWRKLSNGVGWNTETTLNGYPLAIPTAQLNDSLFGAARSALEQHGATVERIDETQTEGISLGHVAHSQCKNYDYLLAIRHTYKMVNQGKGSQHYKGEVRASLFDTRFRRRPGWIFGKKDQTRWIKYRRMIEGPEMPTVCEVIIEPKNKERIYRPQFSPESIDKTLETIAKKIRDDLVNWPHKDQKKHAAQRPGFSG